MLCGDCIYQVDLRLLLCDVVVEFVAAARNECVSTRETNFQLFLHFAGTLLELFCHFAGTFWRRGSESHRDSITVWAIFKGFVRECKRNLR